MCHRVVARCLLLVVFVALLSVGVGEETVPTAPSEQKEYHDLLELFVETFNEVDRHYVDSISRRELMEAAIEGMLSRLDQRSSYITPAELEAFRRQVKGELGGIGIHITISNGRSRTTRAAATV